MNGDVVRLIDLDEILGVFFRGVVNIALEPKVANNFLRDNAPNSACFRVPFDMVAAFERLGHPFWILPIRSRKRATNKSRGVASLRTATVARNLRNVDAVEHWHHRSLCAMEDCFNVTRLPPHCFPLQQFVR